MKNKPVYIYVSIFIIALAFRLPGLSLRTMHGDEAVNAIKFSQLLEKGEYTYNPNEYHGPSLYYCTLPVAVLSSQSTLQELTENTLRIVPLIFCLGLFFLFLMIKNRIGWRCLLFAALLLSVSPIFVYYSRYYIHEMLFAFFSYATIFSAVKLYEKRDKTWAICCGLFLAFMMTTKETWIIILFSVFLSLSILIMIYPEFRLRFFKRLGELSLKVYFAFIFTFVVMYSLLFTSFLQNPPGLWDSIAAVSAYWNKTAANSVHVHPWYQYFKWLMFSSTASGFWSEGIIGLLAIAGSFYSFKKYTMSSANPLFFMKFIALFSLFSLLIFSAILYKTPWNALSFWFGLIILSGFGFYAILDNISNKRLKILFLAVISITVLHLAWQGYQLNFLEYENPDNPYAYAHPKKDIFRIIESLQLIAEKHADKKNMYIQVIARDNDYWPLPWYLKDFKNIGWWNRVDMQVRSADFIIAGFEIEEKLVHKFYEITPPGKRELYVPLLPDYIDLRPGRKIQAFVTLKTRNLLNL